MNVSERLGRTLFVMATLALGWAGQRLLLADPPRLLLGVALLVLAVLILIGIASWSRPEETSPRLRRLIERWQAFAERTPRAFVLIAAALVAGAAAFVFDSSASTAPWLALLAWAAGLLLLLAGALAVDGGSRLPDRAALVAARWELLLAGGLTLLALLLRAVALERIPPNFGGDEGEMGLMARAVLAGEIRDPFATGWLSHPTLWFFMQAAALRSFGDGVSGLRMLSALIGAATVPALYLFARLLYARRVAFAAAALLAAFHVHIHFSRLGVNNIVDGLLLLIAFAAFFYGYRARSAFGFALAGVALGVGQHFYMGGRLGPVLLAGVLVHQALLNRHVLFEQRWRLGLTGLGFLLGFGPLLYHFLSQPGDFTARLGMVGVFRTGWYDRKLEEGLQPLQIWIDQAWRSFGAFIAVPDRSAWYDPRIPLLDQVSALLFVFGLGWALWRWRKPDTLLLAAWPIGVAVFGGMILVNTPESPRYLIAAPAVCLLIALALEQLAVVVQWAVSITLRASRVLTSTILVGLVAWNLYFYFVEYTPRRTYGWFNTEVATELGNYLATIDAPVYVYFFGPPRMYYGNGAIRFLAPDVPGVDVTEPISSVDQLPQPPEQVRPLFVFLPDRGAELAVVQEVYPHGQLQYFESVAHDTRDQPLFFVYTPSGA